MQKRQKGKWGRMAVTLDMSKAYDRVEWDYLTAVLKRLSFSEQWVQLVMSCVTSVTYSVLVNGKPGSTIVPTRGLRQGDPLSPYLFLLCAESFSSMLNQAENCGLITGAAVVGGGISTNHLLFPDDCVFFCSASTQEWSFRRDLLLAYEKGSGQVLNRQKTSIMFSPNTAEHVKQCIL